MTDKKYEDRMCFKTVEIPFMGLLFIAILLSSAGMVQAEERYPARAIELVCPFDAGGGASLSVHAYSEDLAKFLKVPVNVVNRSGSTGVSGTAYVFRSKKDGYTLLGAPDVSLVIMPVISKEAVPYDPLKDFIPLAYLGSNPSVFAVKKDSPFKTLTELIDYARKNPDKLKNATAGVGSESSLNMLRLCNIAKIKIGEIPFKGGADVVTMLLGGHMDIASSSLASLTPQLKAGTIRALAITSKSRTKDLPDVPTTTELGYPEVNLVLWHAVYAPAGVPQQVIDVLIPALEKVLKSPEVVRRGIQAGLEVEYKSPAEIRKLLEANIQTAKEVARASGLIK